MEARINEINSNKEGTGRLWFSQLSIKGCRKKKLFFAGKLIIPLY